MVYVLHFKEEPIKWQQYAQNSRPATEMDIKSEMSPNPLTLCYDEDDIKNSKLEIASIIKKTGNTRKGLRVTFNDKKLVSVKSSPIFARKSLSASKIVNKNAKIKPKSVLVIKNGLESITTDLIDYENESDESQMKPDNLLNGHIQPNIHSIEFEGNDSETLGKNETTLQNEIKVKKSLTPPLNDLHVTATNDEWMVDLSPLNSLSESESESSQDTIILMTSEESKANRQRIEESLAKYNMTKCNKSPTGTKYINTLSERIGSNIDLRKELLKPQVKKDIQNRLAKKKEQKELSVAERLRLLTLDLDLDYQINFQENTPQENVSKCDYPGLNGEIFQESSQSNNPEHNHSSAESNWHISGYNHQNQPVSEISNPSSQIYSNPQDIKVINQSCNWQQMPQNNPYNYQLNQNQRIIKSPDMSRYQNNRNIDTASLVYDWYCNKKGLNSSKSQYQERSQKSIPMRNHAQASPDSGSERYQKETRGYDDSQSYESHQRRSESFDSFLERQSAARNNSGLHCSKSVNFPISTSAENLLEVDELEMFVRHGCDRTERIRKRYSCDYEGEGSFSRRPSVRGVRPRFGSTNEILKQLQEQSRPPSFAEQQKVRNTWPLEPDSDGHLSALNPPQSLFANSSLEGPKVVTKSAQEGTYIQLYLFQPNNTSSSYRIPPSPSNINPSIDSHSSYRIAPSPTNIIPNYNSHASNRIPPSPTNIIPNNDPHSSYRIPPSPSNINPNNGPYSSYRIPPSPTHINIIHSPSKHQFSDKLLVPPLNRLPSPKTSPTRPLPSFHQGKVSLRTSKLDSLPETQENVIYYHMDV